MLIVYTGQKSEEKCDMKIRLNEDYYFWCCDWCDSENLVLWAKLQDGTFCGACHRPMNLPEMKDIVTEGKISAGLC
jgi:hypothetical protein